MKRNPAHSFAAVALAAQILRPAIAVEAAADGGDQLEEVVVTAEKKPGSAQTTPISMNIYTSDEIVSKRITDIESLTYNDASLNFDRNAGEPYLTLRGISSSDTTEIGDPAVPVAQDGFFVNRSYGLLTSLYDLERIEVLRGPQGTLYGRNAIGGGRQHHLRQACERFRNECERGDRELQYAQFHGHVEYPDQRHAAGSSCGHIPKS
jgi:iron complex outermembrane receptor protein